MRRLAMWAAVLTAAMWTAGCYPADPHTIVRVNPITRTVEFSDTKDNRVQIKNLRFSPDTKEFTLEELTIDNNASAVMAMQVEKMKIVVAEMETAGKTFTTTVESFVSVLRGLKANLTTPIGGASLETGTTAPVTP